MLDSDLKYAMLDVEHALEQIVPGVEKFAKESILRDGFFGSGGGWNDVAGRRICDALVSSVEWAFEGNINLFDCRDRFCKILEDIGSLSSIIYAAKKELE